MNLLLVETLRESYTFESGDARTEKILRLAGPEICLGVTRGPRGIGNFSRLPDGGVQIDSIRWEADTVGPPDLDLVIGLPRPAEARRILVQAAAMGVRRIGLALLDRTPPSYADSRSLAPEALDRLLREGLEQGFHTALPEFQFLRGLKEVLGFVESDRPVSVLDPYLGTCLLGEGEEGPDLPGTIIFGSERGFSPQEQELIRESAVRRRHLGPSIMRTETAVVSALALAHRQMGWSASADRGVIRPE